MASANLRQYFGAEVAFYRRLKGWKQHELAEQVTFSVNTIQAVEQGVRAPSDDLCRRLDAVFGLDGALQRLGKRVRTERPGFRDFLEYEARAWRIRTFDERFIPGLLQTEAYARALLRDDELVEERLNRQKKVLSGEFEVHAILDEAVLLRVVGGPEVMRDQLARLLELPENVMIQIVGLNAGVHPGMDGPLALLDFVKEPSVAHADSRYGGLLIDVPEDVAVEDTKFHTMAAKALDPDLSADWIAAELEEYR